MMSIRNASRDLEKQFRSFETQVDIIENVLKSAKTKPRKLEQLKEDLKISFFKLDEAFGLHKVDVIAKDLSNELEFDLVDDTGKPKILRNTKWIKSQLSRYLETTESVEEKIGRITDSKY